MRNLSIAFLLFTGCASLQNGAESALKPSSVSPQFKDLDAPKVNPFAQPKTKVEVMKVGIKNYDDFFQESAEVNGTVVLADVVLKDTDAFITTTKKNIKTNKELTPAEQAALKKEQAKLTALIKLLEDLPSRSSKLLDASEGLSKGADKTFLGPNALKLPGVIKGLGESSDALKAAATKAPTLLTHAQKTGESLTSLAP